MKTAMEAFTVLGIRFLARWERGAWWVVSPALPRTTFVTRTLDEAKRMTKEYIEDEKATAR